MRVNLEGYILMNLLVNALMLWGACRVATARASAWRIVASAALGALYAVAAYLPGWQALQSLPARGVASLAMVAACCVPQPVMRVVRAWLLFFGVTFLFGGTGFGLFYLLGLNAVPVWVSPVAALVAVALSGAWMRYRQRRALTPVMRELCLRYRGREARMTALLDTGLRLVETRSGLPVVVASFEALEDLLGEQAIGVALGRPHGAFRPLRFRALGGGGTIWAFAPDSMTLDGAPMDPGYVAVSTRALTPDGAYQALIPLSLWGETAKGGTIHG